VSKKPIRPAGRGSDQFVIRFPEGMRDRIAKLAAANGRSMNAELIDRLEKSMDDSDDLKDLEVSLNDLWVKVLDHEEYLAQLQKMLRENPLK
jgi:predicted DNA-binding protein